VQDETTTATRVLADAALGVLVPKIATSVAPGRSHAS
jgi:hypothetical protein